jgi:hypothetical protein
MRAALWPGQLAFARDALMFLTGTLDAILELAPIVRELFDHFVGSAGHVATYDGPEADDLLTWNLCEAIAHSMPGRPRSRTVTSDRESRDMQ